MNHRIIISLGHCLLIASLVALIGCSEDATGPDDSSRGPSIWYVDVDANGARTGKTWINAFNHPSDAMDAASDGDEIWIAEGTYYGPGDRHTPVIAFKPGVRVYGGFAGGETSISQIDWMENSTVLSGGDSLCHVVTGADDAQLYGCYVSDGYASGSEIDSELRGGGIYCYGAKMRISNCRIANNTAWFGGGIYAELDTVVIDSCRIGGNDATHNGLYYSGGGGVSLRLTSAIIYDCSFYENSATDKGGGIMVYNSEAHILECQLAMNSAGNEGGGAYVRCQLDQSIEPVFEDCDFEDNQADNGGAICNQWVNTRISGCEFDGNSVSERGGAMYSEYSSFTMEHCVIMNNRRSAIYSFLPLGSGQPRIFNCLFFGNEAMTGIDGGAIYNAGGVDPDIECCTIADNSANNGGGIYNESGSSPGIINCIIWGNTSATGDAQIFDDTGSHSAVSYSDVDQDGYDGVSGNIRLDPLFATGYYGDYYLSSQFGGQASDSPCIDAGSDTAESWGLELYVTSTVNEQDLGQLDIGYHYEQVLLGP